MSDFSISNAFYGKENISERDFRRETLIRLAASEKTSNDILGGSFGAVETVRNEYLQVKVQAEISYTCLAGVDRKEEYWDGDTKRTRTVTDWTPTSGTNKAEYSPIVTNTAEAKVDFLHNVRKAISTSPSENWESTDPTSYAVSANAISKAKSYAQDECFRAVAPTKYKDEKVSGKADVTDIVVLSVPEYKTVYNYNGRNVDVSAVAVGAPNPHFNEYGFGADKDREKALKKKKMPFLIAGGALLLLGVVFLCLMSVSSLLATLGYPIAIIGVGLMLSTLFLQRKWNKQITSSKLQVKKAELIKVLEREGYSPLTSEEEKLFA